MTVYLDHNATTPLDPAALAAMLPYLQSRYANPSSVHGPGREARAAVDEAREQIAALVGAHPSQVIFTSGGTEANNLAIKGAVNAFGPDGSHELAISSIEHASVIAPARALERSGWRLLTIAVGADGRVSRESLAAALGPRTRLVSVMAANNETGVVQDIGVLCEMARSHGAWMHTDATQAAGKMPLDFEASGVQMMTLSAHKLYGPKGIGALVVDKSLDLAPLLEGGGHEAGLRSGTENVAAIVGFGVAAERARAGIVERQAQMSALRQRLEACLRETAEVELIAPDAPRLCNTVCFSVRGIDGETMLMQLDRRGFAVSSGSACDSGTTAPSHVLLAMGIAEDVARCAIRVSLGKDSTLAEVEAFSDGLAAEIQRLRDLDLRATA
jgi:cysteine desulfurase